VVVESLSKRNRKVALLEGITAGALFGTGAIFLRLLEGFNVFSKALWRLIIASIFLALLLIVLKRPLVRNLLRKSLSQILVLGVLLGLHFIFFVSAVSDTTILNATVLVNTTPIWSMFVSSFFFKLKPSRLAVLGILASFVGVSVITFGDISSRVGAMSLKGDLEAIFAAVVEAFYLSYGRDTRRKLPLLSLMLTIYVVSAFAVLIGAAVTNSNINFPTQPSLILLIIGMGLLPTAIAHTFYFSSLSHLKSFETATMALLEPIGATLLGILIFAEVPATIFVLGAVLVLGGIVFVALSK